MQLRNTGLHRQKLSVIKDQYRLSDFFVDPMEIVARKVIPLCGGKLK